MTEERLNTQDGGGLFPRLQQQYGLRANPLDMDTPFFPDAMRHYSLEALRHLCGFGDMALLLTGAAGAGKTRLLAELVRNESSRLNFHRIPASALTSSQALSRDLKKVALSALRGDESPRDLVYNFFRWSESQARKGRRMVLLIDDADGVPPELLRLILAGFLASERNSAAVPMMAGTDSLVGILELDASSTSVHQIHLRPLTREEVATYLEPRIRQAGGKASELLGSARLTQIHALSQGSFGRLKRVTPGVWLDMVPVAPRPHRFSGLSLSTFAWPILALVLLGASWWFVSEQHDGSVMEKVAEDSKPEQIRRSITIGPATKPVPLPEPEPEFQQAQKLDPARVVEQQPKRENQPNSKPEPEIKVEPEQDIKAEPKPVESVSFNPKDATRFVPVETLRRRDGWTIQLVAGHFEQTALSVLNEYAQLESLVYTRAERKGKPWFLVFYGQYETKAAAQNGASKLPETLRKSSPWIRTTKNL